MKKKALLVGVIVFAVMTCLMATSCLSVLSALEVGYRNALDTNSISEREYAYGDDNALGVSFYDGKMYAEWDYYTDYTYALNVKKNGQDAVKYAEGDEGFVVGRTCLSDLGYTFSDNLVLTLEITQKSLTYVRNKTVGYTYTAMTAKDYDKYVTPVKAGFKGIDYYMGNRAEFFDFFSYLLIFREGCKYDSGCYELEAYIYMGYDYTLLYHTSDVKTAFAYEVYSAIDAYEDSAAYSYSYDVDQTGKYGKIYLKFTYDTNPKFTTDTASKYRNATDTSDIPHYKLSENERTFAIDKDSNVYGTIPVQSSDQLYFALKKGYRPVPEKGSNADYLYAKMKEILSELNADGDSQINKVHNIYDYIVNTVVYDYEFTENVYKDESLSTGQLFSYRCLYMEGVFGLGENGVFNDADRIAICDGLSKAFLSLCTIEGIPCLKISGTVSEEGHAWNKVYVNNAWYMVDTTWGNSLETTTGNEYLNHEYLLVPDDSKHVESSYITYPVASRRYDFGTWINNNPNKNSGGNIRYPFGWGFWRNKSHDAA